MILYLVNDDVKCIDTSDIISVDIITDRKHKNYFDIYVTDKNQSYRFYSISYATGYDRKECIDEIRGNLIKNFCIEENKIRVS